MRDTQWFVYIIATQKGRLYTGITTDIERRLRQHKGELKGGAKFFRSDAPLAVVYHELHPNRSEASQREAQIKRFTAAQKQALIHKS